MNTTLNRTIPVLIATLFILNGVPSIGNPMKINTGKMLPVANADSIHQDTIHAEGISPEKGIAFYEDQLIIYSNSRYQQKMIPGHISFGHEDTYISAPDQLDKYPKERLANNAPFATSPAGMAVSTSNNMLYYTAAGKNRKDKIFAVPVERGRAGSQVALSPAYADILPFCENGDNYRHPAVSPNGELMVFASDRRGAMGGFDLFMVQKNGETWERPVHLGPEINSVQDELYPFIDSENNLFFSSEGHSGFGGMDIYMCRYTGEGWERPINLMQPVNSEKDEFGIKMDPLAKTAFYTTHGAAGMDAWQLIRLELDGAGTLPGELHDRAMNAFEKMFGVAFSSTSEQQVKFPEPISPEELLAEQEAGQASVETEEVTTEAEEKVVEPAENSPVKETREKSEPEMDIETEIQPEPETQTAMEEEKEATKAQEQQAPIETEVKQAGKPAPQAEEKVEPDANAPVFRIQITSTRNSAAGKKVTVAGKTYTVFEYFYKGAYRQTVGAFRDLDEAKSFQSQCRSAGYSQAFVAAFINDERVTDPAVFRR